MSSVPTPSAPRGSGLLPPVDARRVPTAVSRDREKAARLSPHGPRSRVHARRHVLGLPRAMVRAAGAVALIVALGVGIALWAAPDHDRHFWSAYRALDPQAAEFHEQLRALPVHQVTDPDLRAFHYGLLKEMDLAVRARNGEASALPALLKVEAENDALRQKLTHRYGP